jgi:serum/glucocorticoid-regulated kinase 2
VKSEYDYRFESDFR